HGSFAGKELRHAGFSGIARAGGLAALLGETSVVNEQATGFDTGFHIGNLLLDHLKLTDGAAKRLPFTGINEAGFVSRFGDAERLGRDADTPGVEHRHGDFAALAALAEHVFERDAVILIDNLASGAGTDTELWLLLAANEAG